MIFLPLFIFIKPPLNGSFLGEFDEIFSVKENGKCIFLHEKQMYSKSNIIKPSPHTYTVNLSYFYVLTE